ncbi:hypothetical protein ACLPAF_02565 [Proteus mirabilis]|uniref:hypothetical protein n=1 Tax=Enterobacterales TaxID=91347 RepID=UPI0038927B0D
MNTSLLQLVKGMERRHWETAIILKISISAGLAAAYFLPTSAAIAVGISTNLLWLWKL